MTIWTRHIMGTLAVLLQMTTVSNLSSFCQILAKFVKKFLCL